MFDQVRTDRFEANSRRMRLCAALGVFALAVSAGCAKAPVITPVVEAGGEVLVGLRGTPDNELAIFRGVPYAAAPVGDLRWRPPVPHEPRPSRVNASRFGSACPQLQGNPDWYRDVAQKFGSSGDGIPDLENISEDCLFLNVWTRNLGGEDAQPVMVWIHGGSNVNGFAHEPNYRGYNLAKHGVVVVSINYRLGAIGFLSHPALSAESKRNVSGNYGLLDQIAALRWVQDNIASFGGDPERVTVFGESAGAGDIGTLIASPLAKGLFDRAIIQSGGYQLYDTATVADAEAHGVKLMTALGVSDGPGQLDAMRALTWQEIFKAAPSAAPGGFTSAVVDGWLLPKPAREIFELGEQNPTEIVIGSNANEWLMYFTQPVTETNLHEVLRQRVSEGHRAEVLVELNKAAGKTATERLDLLTGAADFHCPSLAMAELQLRLTDRVYVYRFSRVRPRGERVLAYHGAEIPYVFDTADYWLPADAVDWNLTDTMLAYWTQFAKTGDPNGAHQPEWPAFDPRTDAHQDLGDEARAAAGLQRAFCEALDRGRM